MSGYTSIIDSSPAFVAGTFDAKDVRLSTHGNALPGLFANGDFAVSQRGAGADMSVDIAQGRAFVDPGYTHGGLYLVRRTSGTAYNTSSDGGYTWTAADATNPRIDLVCLEVADTDEGGSYTGFKFRIVDGTPNASATHQLETAYWPAVPSGCVPIAAIKVPAAATTLTTTNITNLNPIGGTGRLTYNAVSTAETTTSSSYARLTNSNGTADFVCMYIPHANALARIAFKAHWKISVASGTQSVSILANGNLLKAPINTGAPAQAQTTIASLGTFYSHLATTPDGGAVGSNGVLETIAGATADVSDVSTGQAAGSGASATAWLPMGWIDVHGLAAGWYVFETKWATTANTLTAKSRQMWGMVLA